MIANSQTLCMIGLFNRFAYKPLLSMNVLGAFYGLIQKKDIRMMPICSHTQYLFNLREHFPPVSNISYTNKAQ